MDSPPAVSKAGNLQTNLPRIMAAVFALINCPFWVWYLRNPELNNPKNNMEAGMGAFFVSMFIMGPGTILFLVVAWSYIALYQAGAVGPMPMWVSNSLLVGSGLLGWGTTGFLTAKFLLGLKDLYARHARR